jgi:hypothetical protein
MKLQTFDIPQDPALLAEWLEGHVLGLDLRQLVMELEILGGSDAEPKATLNDVLGDQLPDVLQLGLRSLSPDQLRRLLRQPELLRELQLRVLEEGGDYWTTVPASALLEATSNKTWQRLENVIRESAPKTLPTSLPTLPRKAWLWVGTGWLTAAAVVLFAFFVQADRVRQMESRLDEQSTLIDNLRKDLLAQQALAANRTEPANLPKMGHVFVQAERDPTDLPGGDPEDLPEIQ